MTRFDYYNDTRRDVSIHSATISHGCQVEDTSTIEHGEIRTFELPPGTYPWVKMWDYGPQRGLQILVSPHSYPEEEIMQLSDIEKENIKLRKALLEISQYDEPISGEIARKALKQ